MLIKTIFIIKNNENVGTIVAVNVAVKKKRIQTSEWTLVSIFCILLPPVKLEN